MSVAGARDCRPMLSSALQQPSRPVLPSKLPLIIAHACQAKPWLPCRPSFNNPSHFLPKPDVEPPTHVAHPIIEAHLPRIPETTKHDFQLKRPSANGCVQITVCHSELARQSAGIFRQAAKQAQADGKEHRQTAMTGSHEWETYRSNRAICTINDSRRSRRQQGGV